MTAARDTEQTIHPTRFANAAYKGFDHPDDEIHRPKHKVHGTAARMRNAVLRIFIAFMAAVFFEFDVDLRVEGVSFLS